jgi:hypothetical protein
VYEFMRARVCGLGTIDFDEFVTMIQSKKKQTGPLTTPGGGKSAGSFIDALRQSARAIKSSDQLAWLYGVPIQMPNGTFSAVFSQLSLDVALEHGARPVSSMLNARR